MNNKIIHRKGGKEGNKEGNRRGKKSLNEVRKQEIIKE